MSQSKFISYIKQLYKDKRELTILEVTYLIIAIISFLVAAIIALLNQSLGVALLIIPFVSFLALSANMIVWALVRILLDESIKNDHKKSEVSKGESEKVVESVRNKHSKATSKNS